MTKEVKRTNNYKLFKQLTGNRDVSPVRIRKIVESINKVGYITSPIIVNEKMEVIDGQGRLKALEVLGLPVEYIEHKGAGIDECLSMNIHQTNWTMRDYIKSYAERGNQSYIFMQQLLDEFGDLSTTAVLMAAQDTTKVTKKIYNGELIMSEEQYNRGRERLIIARRIIDNMRFKNGARSHLEYSLLICLMIDGVDVERLERKLVERSGAMRSWNSTMTCLQSIEEVYNENISYPVFIVTEYKKTLFAKLAKFGDVKGKGLITSMKNRMEKAKKQRGEGGI